MATTGVQSFNPSLGQLGAYALKRCGISRTEITAEHLEDVAMAANFVFSDLATEQPNLWKLVQNQVSLVQGTSQYTLPANVLLVTDAIIRTTIAGQPNDRVIWPISKTTYLAYPNKATQSPPTVYWQDRITPIVMNLYPTPDGNGPYTLVYLAIQQNDDAAVGAAATLDLPYRFLNAFKDGLVAELALTYALEKAPLLLTAYQGADGHGGSKARAQIQDREMTPIYLMPGLSGYYRG